MNSLKRLLAITGAVISITGATASTTFAASQPSPEVVHQSQKKQFTNSDGQTVVFEERNQDDQKANSDAQKKTFGIVTVNGKVSKDDQITIKKDGKTILTGKVRTANDQGIVIEDPQITDGTSYEVTVGSNTSTITAKASDTIQRDTNKFNETTDGKSIIRLRRGNGQNKTKSSAVLVINENIKDGTTIVVNDESNKSVATFKTATSNTKGVELISRKFVSGTTYKVTINGETKEVKATTATMPSRPDKGTKSSDTTNSNSSSTTSSSSSSNQNV